MAEDLYSDGPPASEPTDNGEEAAEETESAQTALLPTSFFPDQPEPGKECTVRVARVHDDQVEVEYVHSPEGGELPEEPVEAPAPAAMGMGAMME